jgi:DNA polymerase-3 subunit alpha
VESYESLYLKAHFPLEFMVGVINNFGGFYKTEFYLHEARMNGADIKPPCVNTSNHLTHIQGTTIYLGFIHVKELEHKVAERIPQERMQNGPYQHLADFVARVPIRQDQLIILIRVGAFRWMDKPKKELLWEAHAYYNKKVKRSYTPQLFEEKVQAYQFPNLKSEPLEQAFDEMDIVGFPLCNPFLLMDSEEQAGIYALDMPQHMGKKVKLIGYVVTIKGTSTKNKESMYFGTFFDEKGHVFDTVHFPNEARRYPYRGKGFYVVHGKVVEDHGYPMVEVHFMKKMGWKVPEAMQTG